MSPFHEPVLLAEVVAYLGCASGGTYVDGTIGGGGHAERILAESAPNGRLIGIDRDPEALAEAAERLAPFGARVILLAGNCARMAELAGRVGIERVDGILLDLGVSSHQLDTADRGFAFSRSAPLDMRMNQTGGITAGRVVNTLPGEELERVIREYGEDPMAGRIAKALVEARTRTSIATTGELASIVQEAVPRSRRGRTHPATRTFQALRIYVNEEMASLQAALEQGIDLLSPGGRVCVISYHSLEDRLVKNAFRAAEGGCTCPSGMPVCRCDRRQRLRVLTRKPVRPGREEVQANPRGRSAKLRAAERI